MTTGPDKDDPGGGEVLGGGESVVGVWWEKWVVFVKAGGKWLKEEDR